MEDNRENNEREVELKEEDNRTEAETWVEGSRKHRLKEGKNTG